MDNKSNKTNNFGPPPPPPPSISGLNNFQSPKQQQNSHAIDPIEQAVNARLEAMRDQVRKQVEEEFAAKKVLSPEEREVKLNKMKKDQPDMNKQLQVDRNAIENQHGRLRQTSPRESSSAPRNQQSQPEQNEAQKAFKRMQEKREQKGSDKPRSSLESSSRSSYSSSRSSSPDPRR